MDSKYSKEDIFKAFNDLIFQIAHQFYIWRYLQKPENNSGYNMRANFWVTILSSLQYDFLLNLANIFDENDKRVLSIYTYLNEISMEGVSQDFLLKIKDLKYLNVLKGLVQWRNNYLAHKNIYFTINTEELGSKFPFKYEEIELLLNFLIEILELTKKFFNELEATDFNWYYKDLEKKCIFNTQFVLENGLNTPGYNSLKK